MSKVNATFPFLQLPPELRNYVYEYMLYDEDDERIGYICPTILLINQHIYSEASRIQYAKLHTLTVSWGYISFLGRRYQGRSFLGRRYQGSSFLGHRYLDGITEGLPLSFPYHKLEALRIRILRPVTQGYVLLPYNLHTVSGDCRHHWPLLKEHMEELSKVMRAIVDRGFPLRRLILDLRRPSVSLQRINFRDYGAMHLSICAVLGMLDFDNKGLTQTMEIVLGSWAKESPETIRLAHNWGSAALCNDSREESNGEENGGPVIVFEEAMPNRN